MTIVSYHAHKRDNYSLETIAVSQLSFIQYMGLCVFSLPHSHVMTMRMCTLSYYHHQIGSMNHLGLGHKKWYPLYVLLCSYEPFLLICFAVWKSWYYDMRGLAQNAVLGLNVACISIYRVYLMKPHVWLYLRATLNDDSRPTCVWISSDSVSVTQCVRFLRSLKSCDINPNMKIMLCD